MRYIPPAILAVSDAIKTIESSEIPKSDPVTLDSKAPFNMPGTNPAYEADE